MITERYCSATASVTSQEVAAICDGAATTCEKEDDADISTDCLQMNLIGGPFSSACLDIRKHPE